MDYLETTGTVTASKVGVRDSVRTGDSAIMREMYYPDITYEYTVEGTVYQNNQFWPEMVRINQADKIEALVEQFPVGAVVPVYYNPYDPADSYLQPLPDVEMGRQVIWAIAIGVMLLFAAVVIIFAILQG